MSGTYRAEFGSGEDVITLHDAATSFPMPTAETAGASIERWRATYSGKPFHLDVTFTADTATALTGPVGLYGIRGNEKPVLVGELKGGENIVVGGANTGASFAVSAGAFDRLVVGGVAGATITPSNSAEVTVTVRPLHVHVD